MHYFYYYGAMLLGSTCLLITITTMHHRQRHNVGNFGWTILTLFAPPVGLVAYFLFGGRKISTEHENRSVVALPGALEPNDSLDNVAMASIAVQRGLPAPSEQNWLTFLTSPEAMHRAVFELIDLAETRLYLHSYILIDDGVGAAIVDRLCEKAQAGVDVRLMIDGAGSFLFPEALLQKLVDAGGRTARFKPMSKFSRFSHFDLRNHRKMIVVDGNRALLGGANFVEYEVTSTPDQETWIDYLLRIDGMAANQMEAVFCSDWEFATGEEVPSNRLPFDLPRELTSTSEAERSTLQLIVVGPDGPNEILTDLWIAGIARAQERVWIVTPYFVPPPLAMQALSMAARRGVDVRVMYPDESDVSPADYARHDYVHDLHALGVSILRYPEKVLHAKLLLIDREVVYGGSANFDMRSFFLNYELIIGIFDKVRIDEYATWIDDLAGECTRGPCQTNLKRRVLGMLSRTLAEEL